NTRRDFIAACMFSGGFTVEGDEPIVTEENGNVDVERTVESWIDAFDAPEDKLSAGREIRACLQQILDANSYATRQSRVEARGDALFAEMALTISPVEYARGIICKRPDIRQSLAMGAQLRRLGAGLNPALKAQIDSFFGESFGLDLEDPTTRALLEVDVTSVDCSVDRICEIRGSVPVEVLSDTMYIFDIPMRQVLVHAGQCEGQRGFVNERFISF
ncbi:MAG: hypothetical protein ABJQ90_10725, partial [Parasphingorhabdus sp.]